MEHFIVENIIIIISSSTFSPVDDLAIACSVFLMSSLVVSDFSTLPVDNSSLLLAVFPNYISGRNLRHYTENLKEIFCLQ
jgi:hypothetical protein